MERGSILRRVLTVRSIEVGDIILSSTKNLRLLYNQEDLQKYFSNFNFT